MSKQGLACALVILLLLSFSAFAGGKENSQSKALSVWSGSEYEITSETVAFGNLYFNWTTSLHEFRFTDGGANVKTIYVTFFIENVYSNYGDTIKLDPQVYDEVHHLTSQVANGTWHHYYITGIDGHTFTDEVVFNFFFNGLDCRPWDQVIPITVTTDGCPEQDWHNQFVHEDWQAYDPEDKTSGERAYLEPYVTFSVEPTPLPLWRIVDSNHVGGIVEVPVYLPSINFGPGEGYQFTIEWAAGLTYVEYIDEIFVSNIVEDVTSQSVTIDASFCHLPNPPATNVHLGTLRLQINTDQQPGAAYIVISQHPAIFTGCEDYADTSDFLTYVYVVAETERVSFIFEEVGVTKGSSNYPYDFAVKTNYPLNTGVTSSNINMGFTFYTGDLTYTSFNEASLQVDYNGGDLYWEEYDYFDTVTVHEHALWTSEYIVASESPQDVAELLINTGSTCAKDYYNFVLGPNQSSILWDGNNQYWIDNWVVTRYVENRIEHDELVYDNGWISVTGCGGGPSCPALYVWTGRDFALEDYILTHSQTTRNPQPADDFYKLQRSIYEDEGVYRIQIREFENEITFLDQAELIVVDYPRESQVGISPTGEIVTHSEQLTPIAAVDESGNDILDLIRHEDGLLVNSESPSYIVLTFQNPYPNEPGHRFSLTEIPDPNKRKELADTDGDWTGGAVYAEVEDITGTWHFLGGVPPREYTRNSGRELVFNSGTTELGETFRVKVTWRTSFSIDCQKLSIDDGSSYVQHRLSPLQARHSAVGKALVPLTRSDADVVTISPGETVDLQFRVPAGTGQKGFARAFFLKTHGYYKTLDNLRGGPSTYVLNSNYPNPFNPSTTIGFSIPENSDVSLVIYNVLGQEVKTLHDGALQKGYHELVWEGDANDGTKVASGVYFYRLKAGDYTQSRKMTLIK